MPKEGKACGGFQKQETNLWSRVSMVTCGRIVEEVEKSIISRKATERIWKDVPEFYPPSINH